MARRIFRFLPPMFLLFVLASVPTRPTHAAAAGAGEAPPAGAGTIFRYSGPAGGNQENYAAKVLERGPEFSEPELLRFCDDVYPMAGKNPEAMRRYMVERKGWESDRVFYMMAKVLFAGHAARAETRGSPPPAGSGRPTAGEIALVRKHRDRIPGAFGGGRVMDNPGDPAYRADVDEAAAIDPFADESAMAAVLAANPEFSEPELLRALADITGGRKLSMNELVENMRQQGWERNRAFYMAFRIRVGYAIVTDNKSRKAFQNDLPVGLPTPNEEAAMKKHLAKLKAAQYIP